jgi:hypothetical protein
LEQRACSVGDRYSENLNAINYIPQTLITGMIFANLKRTVAVGAISAIQATIRGLFRILSERTI